MSETVKVSRIYRKQSLHASVIRNCTNCGAPGYWHNIPDSNNPGCFAPEKVTKVGSDPVGPVCPQCGAAREAVEPHGEIWSREFKPKVSEVVLGAIKDAFKRKGRP